MLLYYDLTLFAGLLDMEYKNIREKNYFTSTEIPMACDTPTELPNDLVHWRVLGS